MLASAAAMPPMSPAGKALTKSSIALAVVLGMLRRESARKREACGGAGRGRRAERSWGVRGVPHERRAERLWGVRGVPHERRAERLWGVRGVPHKPRAERLWGVRGVPHVPTMPKSMNATRPSSRMSKLPACTTSRPDYAMNVRIATKANHLGS
eukprot:5611722-Prymnesium_polylepis.1